MGPDKIRTGHCQYLRKMKSQYFNVNNFEAVAKGLFISCCEAILQFGVPRRGTNRVSSTFTIGI